METYIISTLVENKPGVLQKVSSMFRSRGFNIDSISVGPIESSDISRMTITIKGDERTVDQLVKQLKKLIDVIEVNILDPKNTVYRELVLIKVNCKDTNDRNDVIIFSSIYNAKVVDVTKESMIVELTGTPDKIDSFIELLKAYNIIELARTGVTALARGNGNGTRGIY
ncbi:MAG: acetolactate synthase small subunit [Nitrososphaerales archaeon]